jgi:hypothetical protein
MIKRIVKLTFQEDKVDDFLSLFEQTHQKIRSFPGCKHLELLRGIGPSNVFFTYSFWESEDDLEKYRHSELFRSTWSKTKVLFAGRPEAWSVEPLDYS